MFKDLDMSRYPTGTGNALFVVVMMIPKELYVLC